MNPKDLLEQVMAEVEGAVEEELQALATSMSKVVKDDGQPRPVIQYKGKLHDRLVAVIAEVNNATTRRIVERYHEWYALGMPPMFIKSTSGEDSPHSVIMNTRAANWEEDRLELAEMCMMAINLMFQGKPKIRVRKNQNIVEGPISDYTDQNSMVKYLVGSDLWIEATVALRTVALSPVVENKSVKTVIPAERGLVYNFFSSISDKIIGVISDGISGTIDGAERAIERRKQ